MAVSVENQHLFSLLHCDAYSNKLFLASRPCHLKKKQIGCKNPVSILRVASVHISPFFLSIFNSMGNKRDRLSLHTHVSLVKCLRIYISNRGVKIFGESCAGTHNQHSARSDSIMSTLMRLLYILMSDSVYLNHRKSSNPLSHTYIISALSPLTQGNNILPLDKT